MSDVDIAPTTIEELQAVVTAESAIIPVGAQTKRPLLGSRAGRRVSLAMLRGITQYEPSEFTFTALAGTPLAEIQQTLAGKKQYLPFDPLLVRAGATIGGTVAAGLSGPGRFRYGGIRDFLLAVQWVDGQGKAIRAGGKVVKNAAGFDIPKFMVGSLGRFGVLTELTFKVFPMPIATTTLRIACHSHAEARQRMTQAAAKSWELDAIDYDVDSREVYLRIAGPTESNQAIQSRIVELWKSAVTCVSDAETVWDSLREMALWPDHAIIAKVPVTPALAEELIGVLKGRVWLSAAANVMWCGMKDNDQVDHNSTVLSDAQAPGLVFTGGGQRYAIGQWPTQQIATQLKSAFDPASKFSVADFV